MDPRGSFQAHGDDVLVLKTGEEFLGLGKKAGEEFVVALCEGWVVAGEVAREENEVVSSEFGFTVAEVGEFDDSGEVYVRFVQVEDVIRAQAFFEDEVGAQDSQVGPPRGVGIEGFLGVEPGLSLGEGEGGLGGACEINLVEGLGLEAKGTMACQAATWGWVFLDRLNRGAQMDAGTFGLEVLGQGSEKDGVPSLEVTEGILFGQTGAGGEEALHGGVEENRRHFVGISAEFRAQEGCPEALVNLGPEKLCQPVFGALVIEGAGVLDSTDLS